MNRQNFRLISMMILTSLASMYAPWAFAQEAPAKNEESNKVPALHILEANNNSKVVVQNADKAGPLILHLEETGGAEVPELRVFVKLSAPDGTPVADIHCAFGKSHEDLQEAKEACSKLQGKLEVGKWAALSIKPKISEWKSGTYKGHLILLSEKIRHMTELELIKADVPPPEMTVPEEVYGQYGKASFSLLFSQDQSSPNFYMNSTKCGAKVQRNFEIDKDVSGAGTSPAGSPNAKTYAGTISDLPMAGDCEGELLAFVKDKQVAESKIKILTRFNRVWGVGLIAVGVGISGIVRYYAINRPETRNLTKRVLRQLAALDQFENAAKPLDDKEKQIIGELRTLLLSTRERFRWFNKKPEEKDIVSIEKKIGLLKEWVPVYRRRKALCGLNDEDRKLIDDALKSAEQGLCGGALDDAGFDNLPKALKEAQEKIRSVLQGQVDAFLKEVQGEDEKLKDELAPIKKQIKEVETALETNAYEQANVAFDKARLDYARILAKQFLKMVEDNKGPFSDPKKWNQLCREVKDRISEIDKAKDADDAVSVYQDAYLHYLRKMLEAAETEAETLSSKAQPLIERQNPKTNELERGRKTVAEAIEKTKTAIRNDDLSSAKQSYDEALQEIKVLEALIDECGGGGKQGAVLAPLLGAIVPLGGSSLMNSLAAWLVPSIIPEGPGDGTSGRWQVELDGLDRITGKVELALQIVVVAIALVLGSKVLGLDVQTWGTCSDMLNAFLWGVGLSQVSGTAYQGLPQLRDKIAKPATTSS